MHIHFKDFYLPAKRNVFSKKLGLKYSVFLNQFTIIERRVAHGPGNIL
jgi:hypothetical protein